jgi:hypothetical protein
MEEVGVGRAWLQRGHGDARITQLVTKTVCE